MRKTKKFVVTVLIITLILGIVPRQTVFAEELIEPTPTPAPSTPAEPEPQTTEPTPTPEPTPDPSPTPCPADCETTPVGEVDQTNEGTVEQTVTAGSDTGNNTIGPEILAEPEATDSAQPETEPEQGQGSESQSENHDSQPQNGAPTAISTGDANTQVDVINLVNTNDANSDTSFQIENVFGDQTGDINLVDAAANAPDPSLLLVNQTNTATVTNFILVYANSGWNLVTDGLGEIQTGAAYATVNVINFINANLANSQLSFVIINIFGTLDGNIVLPEPSQLATLLGGNFQLNQLNTGVVNNSITATSDTGGNGLEGGSIETGNATTTANVIDNVNSNMLGGTFYHLLVNNYGTWNGMFAGWGNLAPQDPHYGHMFFDINNMPALGTLTLNGEINQTNDATVTNTIVANSNTGHNTINGDGNIRTGNAFTTVNLLNFINSNWAGVRGFYGLVNIFGTLNGHIGDAEHIAAIVPTAVIPLEEPSEPQPETKSSGGALVSNISTNVGTHVNPGDTPMIFINVQNTGTGKVYNGKLIFNLTDPDGYLVATKTFEFGELNPGQKVKISFGAQMSKAALGGTYSAFAEAVGTTGPEDSGLSSPSSTAFLLSGADLAGIFDEVVPEVLAAGNEIKTASQGQQLQGGIYYSEIWGNLLLFLLFLTYIRMLQLVYKKDREQVVIESSDTIS